MNSEQLMFYLKLPMYSHEGYFNRGLCTRNINYSLFIIHCSLNRWLSPRVLYLSPVTCHLSIKNKLRTMSCVIYFPIPFAKAIRIIATIGHHISDGFMQSATAAIVPPISPIRNTIPKIPHARSMPRFPSTSLF